MKQHPLREDLDHVLEHTLQVWDVLRGQRLFITGGSGFVGMWLLESFVWANEKLNLGAEASILTRDPDRFRAKAPHVAEHQSIQLLKGDVRSFEYPAGEFPFVIHAATEPQFEPTPEEPAAAFDRDVEGTRRVLEFARSRGTKRLLFTSSGAVYGKQPPDLTHIPEDYPGAPATTDPNTAYGQAKRVSEFLCTMYGRQYGFSVLIARLFAFVGPYLPLDANFAVGNFIRDALNGGPIRVKGDGTPYRSYLYAADLTIWLWTILIRGESGRPYNVGSEEAVTIRELAETVAATAVPTVAVQVGQAPTTGSKPARYVPKVQRAENELALQSCYSFDVSLARSMAAGHYK